MSTSQDVLAPPRRISHLPNLLWWLVLVILGVMAYRSEIFVSHPKTVAPLRRGSEYEAFLALSFGKLGEDGPDVIPAAVFRDQLDALKSAGYNPISLRELEAFFRERRPLADKPVLLMFDGVQRDSTEIADAVLAAHQFHGVAFADVEALSASNIDLVSTHRLRQMVASGRWDIGIAGCTRTDPSVENGPPIVSVASLRQAAGQLAEWIRRPVNAVSCERFLGGRPEDRANWQKMVSDAALAIGFIVANPGVNYRDDSPFELRRVRVSRDWKGDDLLAALEARLPKRAQFHDEFQRPEPAPSWVVDRGELKIEKGQMHLSARPGDNGALLTLAGSERWADAEAEVAVDRVEAGQLWISLRSAPNAFVRLGVVAGKAVLQQSDARGATHGMGSRSVPKGRFTLKLRMMGSRAVAMLDGSMIGDRPIQVPSTLRRGPLAIAVWDPKGKAAARIQRVVATPLRTRAVFISPRPGEAVWEEIRRGVDDAAFLSPRRYTWAKGRAAELDGDAAIAMFARHQRLSIMPAVTIDAKAPLADADPLRAQLATWAKTPAIDGLNLVIPPALANDAGWQRMVTALRSEVEPAGRKIFVTLAGVPEVAVSLPDAGHTFALPKGPAKGLEVASGALSFVGPTP